MKFIIPVILSGIISFALFAFMAALVATDDVYIVDVEDWAVVTIINEPQDSDVERIHRVLDPPKKPVKKPLLNIPYNDNHKSKSTSIEDLTMPQVELDIHTTAFEYDPNFLRDSDAMPLSRSLPMYPIEAAKKKLKGWVKLSFDVDRHGKTENIKVLKSEPTKIFDQAAINALNTWKYKAKVENGKTVGQQDLVVKIGFGKY